MASSKSGSSKKDSSTMKTKTRAPLKGGNPRHADDLNKEIVHLNELVKAVRTENDDIKHKLRTLSLQLVDAARTNGNDVVFDPNSDILSIPVGDLTAVIAGFSSNDTGIRTFNKSSEFDENRLEDLETRVTLLNTELAKLFKLKIKVENGLEDIEKCQDYDEAKKKAKYLWYESCGTRVFVTPVVEEAEKEVAPPPCVSSASFHRSTTSTSHSTLPDAIRLNMERVHIATPPGKLPADTHINDMHKDLVKMVVQQLSLYKGNGADWRLFAERVGVPSQLILQWKTMKLPQPMKNVLCVWGDSEGATVRMLHRHLISPQMKCVVLAKRISDFYEVD